MPEDDKMFFEQLGQRIVRLRKERGMTQVELAASLGMSQQSVQAFEVGRRRMIVSIVPSLAELFNVSTDELLGMTSKPLKRGPKSQFQLLTEQASKLPKGKQKIILEMLNGMIQQYSKG